MNFLNVLEQVPDSLKVGVAVSPPTLKFLGIAIADWTQILSAVVALVFLIEKMPVLIQRVKTFVAWIRKKKNESS